MFASTNYFRTLGLPLAQGAGFDATGDNPLTAEPVVIVGYGLNGHNVSSVLSAVGVPFVALDLDAEVASVRLLPDPDAFERSAMEVWKTEDTQ